MRFLIRSFVILLLSFSTAFSQTNDTVAANEKKNAVMLEMGVNKTIAMGDNFVNDAYSLNMGFESELNLLLEEKYLVGFRYEVFGAGNEKPENVGNYKRTMIHTFSGNAGYFYRISEKLNLAGTAGLGWGFYSNYYEPKVRFYDQSAVTALQLKLGYNFDKDLALYGAIRYRYDFLTTETPQEIEDYFDDVQMISFSIGVRIF